MHILKILSEHRSDFTAMLECEHCNNTQQLMSGYHDEFYHTQVVPAITCESCGKDRTGIIPAAKNDQGVVHVPGRGK